MFWKVKSRFFRTYSLAHSIKQTKNKVLLRSAEWDFELLGRSLAYNPFMPRSIVASALKNRHYFLEAIEVDSKVEINESLLNTPLVIANTIGQSSVDFIALLRRYSPCFIVHKDIFISKYQILESLVYGADCIILSLSILDSNAFLELFNYALHLGLNVAIFAESKEEIEFGNSIGVDVFLIIDNSLFSFIADNKIILDLK